MFSLSTATHGMDPGPLLSPTKAVGHTNTSISLDAAATLYRGSIHVTEVALRTDVEPTLSFLWRFGILSGIAFR